MARAEPAKRPLTLKTPCGASRAFAAPRDPSRRALRCRRWRRAGSRRCRARGRAVRGRSWGRRPCPAGAPAALHLSGPPFESGGTRSRRRWFRADALTERRLPRRSGGAVGGATRPGGAWPDGVVLCAGGRLGGGEPPHGTPADWRSSAARVGPLRVRRVSKPGSSQGERKCVGKATSPARRAYFRPSLAMSTGSRIAYWMRAMP